MYNNRNIYTKSFGNNSKINSFNPKKTKDVINNISSKRKYLILISILEFGKEINISSNLITSNQEAFNGRKTFDIPKEQKIKNLKNQKRRID